jgi:hypothetical protein
VRKPKIILDLFDGGVTKDIFLLFGVEKLSRHLKLIPKPEIFSRGLQFRDVYDMMIFLKNSNIRGKINQLIAILFKKKKKKKKKK